MSPGSHLAAVFLERWNLLAFLGSCGFALLSGRPDVGLPFVLAVEVAYLGFAAHRRSGIADAAVALADLSPEALVSRIEATISASEFQRYEELRERCQEMREIGVALQQVDSADRDALGAAELLAKLDQLLLAYLRLLYSRHVLKGFLAKTDALQIKRDIKRFESQLAELSQADGSPGAGRLMSSAQDSLKLSQQRLGNYQKVQSNVELITSRIDGLQAKIQTLAETGVSDREPEAIAKQVEAVRATVMETEETLQRFEPRGGTRTWDRESIDLLSPMSADEQGYADGEDFVYDEDD